jgi:hypothetical protein
LRSRRSRRFAFLAALVVPALSSCAFILDFDELQTETGEETGGKGSGGSGARGGTSGTSGDGGSGDCPSACFDDDPCTIDGCTADGDCTSEDFVGLAPDGIDETLTADLTHRSTIASASDAFFLSNFTQSNDFTEVTFLRLDANAPSNALSTIGTLGGLNINDAGPLSAAGLAVDTAVGRIHAFVGMAGDNGRRLHHVVMDMSYSVVTQTVVLGGYGEQLPWNHPVVANLGGDIAATWINASQGVSLWTGRLAGPVALAAGRAPMTTALLASSENDALVLYGVNGGGVFVEGNGVPAMGVEECQVRPGGYLSSASTPIGIPGFWLGFWTKYGEASGTEPGFLTSDGRGFACSAAGCATAPAAECQNALDTAARNVALVSAVRPGDPTGLVHLVQVTPVVAANDTGELYAAALLSAQRIDFGLVPFQDEPVATELGEPIVLSAMPTAEPDFTGPDWPTVAYVPPDRIAVTWIQPSLEEGSELRIQRYRLCAP